MIVLNKLAPTEDQLRNLENKPETGAIYLINLFKFRDKAIYSDGRRTNLTGEESYKLYGQPMSKVLEKHGAEVVFFSEITCLNVGHVEELWDKCAIVKYPSRKALLEMISTKEYSDLLIHREAGLEGQLNIESQSPISF